MRLTARVTKDSPQFPGLYKWDYEINNVSFQFDCCVHWFCTPEPGWFGGIIGFGIIFPQTVTDLDLANALAPPGWSVDGLPSDWLSPYISFRGSVPLVPGQSANFGFTTEPRLALVKAPCTDSWGNLCNDIGTPPPPFEVWTFTCDPYAGQILPRMNVVPGPRLAVRAGLGKDANDSSSPPKVKIIEQSALNAQGAIDAAFPLGSTFFVELVTEDPNPADPAKPTYTPVPADSTFTLTPTQGGGVQPTVTAANSLFPNNVVIEYDRDAKSKIKYFQAVHLGTVTLTMEPDNDATFPVTVAITVNRPAKLGSGPDTYDERLIDLGHQRGIPPHFLKGQVQRESHPPFNPMSYRYEPLSTDLDDFSPNGQNLRVSSPYASYRLATNDQVSDLHDDPPAHPDPNAQLLQGTGIIPDDIAPRSSTTPQFLMCSKSFDGNVCEDGLTVAVPASDLPHLFLSAKELYKVNDGSHHWWSQAGRPRRNRLRRDPDLLAFTAQTALAASYGLLQILYPTAISPMGWKGVGRQRNPSYLFDTDDNLRAGNGSLPLGAGYLRGVFATENPGLIQDPVLQSSDDFEATFNQAFQEYHNQDDDYGDKVLEFSKSFKPVPSAPIFTQ